MKERRGEGFFLSFFRLGSFFIFLALLGAMMLYSYFFHFVQTGHPVAFSGEVEVDPSELSPFEVGNEVRYLTVANSHRILLTLNGISDATSFIIAYRGVFLNVGGRDFSVKMGEVLEVPVAETSVYLGISKLQGNQAILALSRDKAKVNHEVQNFMRQGKVVFNAIIGFLLIMFVSGMILLLSYWLRQKRGI